MNKIDVRVTVTLPNGKREIFGYALPEETFDPTFRPLPRNREIDPMALHEAMAQRDRRDRKAELIGRSIADAILTAAEKSDTWKGYEGFEASL